MQQIRMNSKIPCNLAHAHPLFCGNLHFVSLELTAEMTVPFPHADLLSHKLYLSSWGGSVGSW
jgi:hypothetical protein